MKDEGSGRPQRADILPSEAGILVRDTLRAARHTLSVGRMRLESSPVPGGDIASGILSRVANRAEGEARRIIGVAVPRREDRTPSAARLLQAMLHTGGSPPSPERITFVRSAYRTLREALALMGARKSLVLESAIEAALAATLPKAELLPASEDIPARFAHQLISRGAVSHVVFDGDGAASSSAAEIGRQACFALGLAITAELGDPVLPDEAGPLMAAACAMTRALGPEVAAAVHPEDFAALYRSYGPHV